MVAGAGLRLKEPRTVCAAATHAVFANDALARLASAGFERMLVTDSVECRAEAAAKLEVVSVVSELAEALR